MLILFYVKAFSPNQTVQFNCCGTDIQILNSTILSLRTIITSVHRRSNYIYHIYAKNTSHYFLGSFLSFIDVTAATKIGCTICNSLNISILQLRKIFFSASLLRWFNIFRYDFSTQKYVRFCQTALSKNKTKPTMLFEFPSGMKRFGSRYHCFVFVGKSKGREHHRDFFARYCHVATV